jgi:subtilisin family serine protease
MYRHRMTRLGYLVRAGCIAAVLFATVSVPAAETASLGSTASQGSTASLGGSLEPNDPYWRQSWSQAVLHMPEVWARTTGSPDIVIATVDTGVDPTIADLQGALVPGWDFIQNDAVPRDTVGHGTHVASVIAARGNNGIGLAGYCWDCRIMPVRVTADGSATGPQISQGIYWAVDHGARIITIGLNSGSQSYDESVAVRYAHDRGVLVIASAGNTGTTDLRYPAAYDGVLPVAAVNDSDVLYFWSTRGSWVPLAAPGCQLVIDPVVGPGTLCGTSFTPAVVAGIAGLMLSLKPSLTPDQIVQTLVSTAVPVAGISGGAIDPLAALNAIAPEPEPSATSGGAGSTGGSATGQLGTTSGTQALVAPRTTELYAGVMRLRLSTNVRVGAGRFDVHLLASRASECQISIALPNGDFVLSVFPPEEPNLLTMSQVVKAGKHRVDIYCDSTRRRSYQLEISAVALPVKKTVAGS